MRKPGDVRTRPEIVGDVDQGRDDMQEKADEAGTVVEDVETVRETLDSLNFGGTAEGGDEVEHAIQSADDATVEVFERKDEELEGLQQENQDYNSELQEGSDQAGADVGKIGDARGRIETQETNNELAKAEEAAREDQEFLNGESERLREELEKSDQMQQQYQAQVHSGRRS